MIGQFGIPGQTAAYSTVDNEFIWGGSANQVEILIAGGVIDSAARDAGSTPTTKLRKGLVLGQITSTKKLVQWDPTATNGSQNVFGVLAVEVQLTDMLGNAQERHAPVIVRCPVKPRFLFAQGNAFVGSAGEFLARNQMAQQGFIFDDDVSARLAGLAPQYQEKQANYTIVDADNGTTFIATTANATFTLPAIKEGQRFEFLRASNHNLVVASSEGDNIIVGNDLSADSITFSTSGQQIGARVRVTAVRIPSTGLRWLAELPQTPFGTAAGSTFTIALAT